MGCLAQILCQFVQLHADGESGRKDPLTICHPDVLHEPKTKLSELKLKEMYGNQSREYETTQSTC